MSSMRKCPHIFIKHAKELEDIQHTNFTESQMASLRLKQKFEMATFNLLKHILNKGKDAQLLGSKLMGQFTLKNSSNNELICNILTPHFNQIMSDLVDQNISFHFKNIQKLDYFYDRFCQTPLPVILASVQTIQDVRDFTSECLGLNSYTDDSIYVFSSDQYELVAMEPITALVFGFGEYVSKIIQDDRISTFHLGFVYRK
ncbi:hypothetical protein M153_189000831 [Pseudoloma neurophilia]|uniref:Uncharacterized protein n=1 Tax=Pseudoloma neurophilia TaxID=146866 RepID=A0A0R0LZB7_9MICR|nr:hypothetical protein M153_189000831 [Pseudoloma neurophilia]